MYINERIKQLAGVSHKEDIYEKATEPDKGSDAEKAIDGITSAFHKHFRDSSIATRFDTSFIPDLVINFSLGKDKNEYKNGISRNDPIFTKIFISGFDNNGNVKSKLKAENVIGGSVTVNSDNPRFVYDSIKVWRNFSVTDVDKLIQRFDKFFAKMKQTIKDNVDRVPEQNYDIEKKLR